MGFIQMAFAASQVLGIPVGLYLANKTNWHSPFILIASISVIVYVIIILKVKPVADHLKLKKNITSFQHFKQTISKKRYITGFAATTLLATGGFMLMPFGSAFTVNNLKIELDHLPIIYVITGLFTIVAGPIIGRLSDRVGKYNMFIAGSILSMIMVLIYCNLGATPLWAVIMINVILFIGITSRIISASALMSAVPEPADRGAFMGINASVQQFSGGIAAFFAGLIVVQEDSGYLDHYDWLGYVVVVAMIITIFMLSFINKMVTNKEEAKLGKWKT